MRLLVDGDVFRWQKRGGISRVYAEILPRLQRLDPSVESKVVVQRPIRSQVYQGLPVEKVIIPCVPSTLRPWQLWHRIAPAADALLSRWWWNRADGDVFHPTYYTVRRDMPMFCFVYDMLMERFPECFDARIRTGIVARKRAAVQRSDVLLCISENTKRDVVEHFGVAESKCRVVPLAGFPPVLPGSKPDEPGPERSPFMLYVGDYEAGYKNFEFLLKCLGADEFRCFSDLDLVVAAPDFPEQAKLSRYAALMDASRLQFRPHCNDADLVQLYRQCSVFVLPSLYEGFGIPVLEALACGAPVACSNTSSLPEVGGDVVRYFDPQSPESLKSALHNALTDARSPGFTRQRRQHAGMFSWDRTAEAFLAAARELGAG